MRTGGLWTQTFVSSVRGRPATESVQRLFLRGKSTAEHLPDLLALAAEVLTQADFSNTERLGKIILESKARREQRLIPAGHALATTRLKARTGVAQAMMATPTDIGRKERAGRLYKTGFQGAEGPLARGACPSHHHKQRRTTARRDRRNADTARG